MSASLVVDLGNTCDVLLSLTGTQLQAAATNPSGQLCGLSGVVVGTSVDLLHSDTFCNLFVTGTNVVNSGSLIVGIQTSDSDVSGTYTDPTSGLPQFPTSFSSGGNLILCSGGGGGVIGAQTSGQSIQSGFFFAAGFVRVGRFVRALFNSGQYVGGLVAGFISQRKTTGSGGGFSWSPTSGTSINV